MKISGHFVGVSVTALIHMAMIVAFMSRMNESGCGATASAAGGDDSFAESRTIEAALARKKVEKKDNQPQKQKKKKFAPQDSTFSRDEERKPEKKKDEPDHKVPIEPDEVDIDSILNKNRSQDDNLSSTGADETPQEGSESGSIWGTERDARGDEYVGELKGRIHSEWRVPALETGTGVALGCVRLDKDGKIVDTGFKKRSSNSNLNRSVSLALKKAPAMEDPVPAHLEELLTVKGICFRFSLEAE